jgi:hypothetical protein
MQQLPVLYKTNKNGSIQQWSIITFDDKYQTNSGQVDGASTPHTTTCEAKGVGKAKTTPAEQALKEAKAKWVKQIKKGYVEDKASLETQELTLPMLAKKVQDHLKKIIWGYWLGLYKLNGLRCTMFLRDGEVFFQGRSGDPYPVIPNIADELKMIYFSKNPKLVVDGELYCHGMHLEDIAACVKKHNEDTAKITFHVFDVFDPNNPKASYETRHVVATSLMAQWDFESIFVKVIGSVRLNSEEEMWSLHDTAVKYGYEGIIARDNTEVWQYGARSATFLKLKKRHDAEFKIVGFAKDKNGGAIPILECDVSGFPVSRKDPTLNPKGTKATFKATFAGTHQERSDIYMAQTAIIGKWMNASYEHLSKYGIPAKPISEGLRDCDVFGNPLN